MQKEFESQFRPQRDEFFRGCKYLVRAPGAFFWCGEHAVKFGQPAILQVIPLFAYVGLEVLNSRNIEFSFSTIDRNLDLVKGDIDSNSIETSAFKQEARVRPFVEYYLHKRGFRKGLRIKIWSQIPTEVGLDSSGAIASALSVALHLLENGDIEGTKRQMEMWRGRADLAIKSTLFRDIFYWAVAVEDCSHSFGSSGDGPFASLVGSTGPMNLLMYLTEAKGFNTGHPIFRLPGSWTDIRPTDVETILGKIRKIQIFGKNISLSPTLKENLRVCAVYCGKQKDHDRVLKEQSERLDKPIGLFSRLLAIYISREDLKRLKNIPVPMADFLRYERAAPTYPTLYPRHLLAQPLGLMVALLIDAIEMADLERIVWTVNSINRYLSFLGLFKDELVTCSQAIEGLSRNVGIKLTGAGGGGDLVVIGEDSEIETVVKRVSYSVHFDSGHSPEPAFPEILKIAEKQSISLPSKLICVFINGESMERSMQEINHERTRKKDYHFFLDGSHHFCRNTEVHLEPYPVKMIEFFSRYAKNGELCRYKELNKEVWKIDIIDRGERNKIQQEKGKIVVALKKGGLDEPEIEQLFKNEPGDDGGYWISKDFRVYIIPKMIG